MTSDSHLCLCVAHLPSAAWDFADEFNLLISGLNNLWMSAWTVGTPRPPPNCISALAHLPSLPDRTHRFHLINVQNEVCSLNRLTQHDGCLNNNNKRVYTWISLGLNSPAQCCTFQLLLECRTWLVRIFTACWQECNTGHRTLLTWSANAIFESFKKKSILQGWQ